VSNLIIQGIKVGQSPIIERQGRGVPQDRLRLIATVAVILLVVGGFLSFQAYRRD